MDFNLYNNKYHTHTSPYLSWNIHICTLPKEVCLPRHDPIDISIYCSLLIIKRRHSYKICGDIKFYIFLNNIF